MLQYGFDAEGKCRRGWPNMPFCFNAVTLEAHLALRLPRAGLLESVSRWLALLKGSGSTMKSRGIS